VLRTTFRQISALTAGETAPEDTDETLPAWPLNDDESVGSRQSQVERSSGVTAVADPRIARVSVGHTGSKIIAVGLRPAGTPKENIKVYNRQTKLAPELAGYGRLAATGAADDNEAPQITLRLRLLRGVLCRRILSLNWRAAHPEEWWE
jgi:hypothetical protein